MICPRCRQAIPDNCLACPECVARHSVSALEKFQLQFLARLFKGECDLVVVPIGEQRHAQMFGEKHRAFCGTQLAPQHKRLREAYHEKNLLRLCNGCRERLDYLMEEALRAASVSIDATAPATPE